MSYGNKKRSNKVLFLLSVLLLVPMTIAGAEGDKQKPLKVVTIVEWRHCFASLHRCTVGLNNWSQHPGDDLAQFVLVIDGTPVEGSLQLRSVTTQTCDLISAQT